MLAIDITKYGTKVQNASVLDLTVQDWDNCAKMRDLLGGGKYTIKNRSHVHYAATNMVYTCDEINEIVWRNEEMEEYRQELLDQDHMRHGN